MSANEFWTYIISWGTIGIMAFSFLLITAALTKTFRLVRDENMELKKPMPAAGWILMGAFILLFPGFSLAAAKYGIVMKGYQVSFWSLWLMNFLVFFLILLFDTFVIDILVLVIWHPKFLNLPEKEAYRSANYHLKTLIPGSITSILLSGISSIFAWLIFFK